VCVCDVSEQFIEDLAFWVSSCYKKNAMLFPSNQQHTFGMCLPPKLVLIIHFIPYGIMKASTSFINVM